jgi:hypothetical protein
MPRTFAVLRFRMSIYPSDSQRLRGSRVAEQVRRENRMATVALPRDLIVTSCRRGRVGRHSGRMILIESITAPPPCVHRRIARRPTVVLAIEDGRNGALEIGRPIQPPMSLWPKPLDLRLERGFDRPVRRLNGDHARAGIGDTASLADALDLRTLLREFASAQD